MNDLSKSLEEIDGENWGDPDSGETGLIRKCLALRKKPLKDFTNDDLTRMILQQIALEYLVPIAINRLYNNPLNSGDYYRGDLLCSLLQINKEFWLECPDLQHGLDVVLDDLNDAVETVNEFLAKYKET
ncbi:contact-dependent growth inhibition system immunity protein [Cohnella phaseoli]|uniref:contact-dependent growth inhibition system immunity protein n=1 Tax=Cohnella phaseoli TaxID=456490 RepID=UPI000E25ECB7|nr:contact-dependent growth inhibition system immunity protein [Cohnella phaseoli]